MAGGRPLKFQSVEELQKKIDAYFKSCDDKLSYVDKDGNKFFGEPYTITGLALALGTTRQTLLEYQERDEYIDTIKTAKTRVENYAEKRLFSPAPTGAIFALKNFDWKDKSESDVNNRYVNKDGEDLTEVDRKILENYNNKIRGDND